MHIITQFKESCVIFYMLSKKEKRAVENLLVLASYIKEHSIYSGKQAEVIDNSIKVVEELIGKKAEGNVEEIELETSSTEAIIQTMLDKFKP